MKCPYCICEDSRVIYVEHKREETTRRRQCEGCHMRFTTSEFARPRIARNDANVAPALGKLYAKRIS